MNETTEGVTASSLAITEKKPSRKNGGCVGIFFQLFDWNRRFAKKKLFSKKLLPPARAKQASKKFGSDENRSKLHLIADESSGGVPNANKNGGCIVDAQHKLGVQTPSLVARLMGLESMPTVQQEKSKKASLCEIESGRRGDFASDQCEFGKEDGCLEKRSAKHKLRSQKLQKTGLLERHPVTRFGAEALQLKNVFSRSRKHNPKLISPIKSPRNHSERNASRLIGAATKILEPGLQARNRAKSALTYSHNARHAPTYEFMSESTKSVSPDPSESSAKSLLGQSSCKNCGTLIDVINSRPNIEDHPSVYNSSVSNYVNPHSQVLARCMTRSPIPSLEHEKEGVTKRRLLSSLSLAGQAEDNVRHHAEFVSDAMPLDRGGQVQWHLSSQQCPPQTFRTSLCFKDKSQRPNEASLRRDRAPPQSKLSYVQRNSVTSATFAISEPKDFVALNRSLIGQTRSWVPAKAGEFKFDKGKKFVNRQDDSLSPRQKRQLNANRQGNCSGMVTSTFDRPRMTSSIAMSGKEMGQKGHSLNCTFIDNQLTHLGERNRNGGCGSKNSDAVTFTFSSPMKHRNGIPAKVERRSPQNASTRKNTPKKNSDTK